MAANTAFSSTLPSQLGFLAALFLLWFCLVKAKCSRIPSRNSPSKTRLPHLKALINIFVKNSSKHNTPETEDFLIENKNKAMCRLDASPTSNCYSFFSSTAKSLIGEAHQARDANELRLHETSRLPRAELLWRGLNRKKSASVSSGLCAASCGGAVASPRSATSVARCHSHCGRPPHFEEAVAHTSSRPSSSKASISALARLRLATAHWL